MGGWEVVRVRGVWGGEGEGLWGWGSLDGDGRCAEGKGCVEGGVGRDGGCGG